MLGRQSANTIFPSKAKSLKEKYSRGNNYEGHEPTFNSNGEKNEQN